MPPDHHENELSPLWCGKQYSYYRFKTSISFNTQFNVSISVQRLSVYSLLWVLCILRLISSILSMIFCSNSDKSLIWFDRWIGYEYIDWSTKFGDTVTWTNKDTTFHTVTSGTGPSDTTHGKAFDSGLSGPTALTTQGKTFSHKFMTAGEFPYFCQLHPTMIGKVVVK